MSGAAEGGAVRAAREPLYVRLARTLEGQIRSGALRIGDKVTSIRSLSRQERVSVSTVLQAYFRLESQGYVEARARSGFYVRTPYSDQVPEPGAGPSGTVPQRIGVGAIIAEATAAASDPSKVPLAAACPDPRLLPTGRLNLQLRATLREHPLHSA